MKKIVLSIILLFIGILVFSQQKNPSVLQDAKKLTTEEAKKLFGEVNTTINGIPYSDWANQHKVSQQNNANNNVKPASTGVSGINGQGSKTPVIPPKSATRVSPVDEPAPVNKEKPKPEL